MISEDVQLKLMAWLDGELPPTEAADMQSLVARDPQARALADELRQTVAALSGHEAATKLPETREFYWSKIQREINRQESAAAAPVKQPAVSWFAWLQGHYVPVGAMAILVCLLGIFVMPARQAAGLGGEIELASDDVGSYTYRDQGEQLTMVWLYDKHADDSQIADSAGADNMDNE